MESADESSDSHLLATKAIQGDLGAFERLVCTWYRRILAICQARLKLRADAEDAAQEVFLRAFMKRHEVRDPSFIGAWFCGIARHVCLDIIRRNQTRRTVPVSDDDRGDSGLQCLTIESEQDPHEQLMDKIHELPENIREVILLHYFEKMTYDQMAEWLGIARSTVNERLSQGRALLRGKLFIEQEIRHEL